MSWIKVEHDLTTSPKFVTLASRLRHGRVTVLGACITLWMLADKHSVDDLLHGMTLEAVDALVELPGFGQALVDIGWLKVHEGGLEVVGYQRHNGTTAKARALSSTRSQSYRSRHATVTLERDGSVTKNKSKSKRENNKTVIPPLPPKGEPDEPTAELFTAPVEEPEVAASYDPSTADLPMPLDTPTFRQAWCQWWKYRRERRLPVYKPTTITERLNSFLAWGEASAVESIRQSISNGWAGLFEPKESKVFPYRREPTPLVSETMPPELVAQIFTDKPRREALAIQADIPPLVGLGVRCG